MRGPTTPEATSPQATSPQATAPEPTSPQVLTSSGPDRPATAATTVAPDTPGPRPQAPLLLDASFILAVLAAEPDAMARLAVLATSLLPTPVAGEVYYKAAERSGVTPLEVREVLLAYGVRLVDLPAEAALHFPALRRIDAARRTEQKTAGERGASLSLADLCLLGTALHTGLAVLTGDRHWATLAPHGLTVDVHLYQRNTAH